MSPLAPERRRYLVVSFVLLLVDQLTKAAIDRSLVLHESRSIVDGLASLTYVRNYGAAFGVGNSAELPFQGLLLALVSLLALGAIGAYAMRLPAQNGLAQTALALIMGGALGNLIDRVRLGYVIDFLDVYWGPHHWPAFNAADSAITVGVSLLVLDIVRRPDEERAAPENSPASATAGEAK